MEFIPVTVFLLFVVIPLLVVLKELNLKKVNDNFGWIISLLILGTIFPNLGGVVLTASLVTTYFLREKPILRMVFLLLSFIVAIQLKNSGMNSGLEEIGFSLILINHLLFRSDARKEEITLSDYLASSLIGSICFFAPKKIEISNNDDHPFIHHLLNVIFIEGVFLAFFNGWINNGINSGFSLNFGQSWYLTIIACLSFALSLFKWGMIGNIFNEINGIPKKTLSFKKLSSSPFREKVLGLVFLSIIFTFIIGIPYLQTIIFFSLTLITLVLFKRKFLIFYGLLLVFLIPLLHTQTIGELKYLVAGLLSLHTFFYYWNEELILSGFGGELWLCLTLFITALYFLKTKFKLLYALPSIVAIILIGVIGLLWMI